MQASHRLVTLTVSIACLGCLLATGIQQPTATITLSAKAQASASPSPTATRLAWYRTREALELTATYWSTFYPTPPDPSYTPYGRDCGILSWYECHVEIWREFSGTATTFAKTPPATPAP